MSYRTIVVCDICGKEQVEAKSVFVSAALTEQFIGERRTYGIANICLACQEEHKIFRILIDKLKLL